MSIKSTNKVAISIIIIIALELGLIILCPRNLDDIYFFNYLVDAVCLIISVIMLLRLYVKNKLDMFEPLTIVSFVYIMMYFFTPIYDICVGELTWYSYNLFQYGIKATLIEFAGFLVFYCFYVKYFTFGSRSKNCYLTERCVENCETKLNVSILLIIFMYAFCFASNVLYLAKSGGNSILYLLTLGLLGSSGTVATTEASIGFISMFSYSLPAITLLYWEYGHSKVLKLILFVPMLMLQVVRGFRFFVIQIVITFFAYYYIKNKKRPRVINIILVFVLMMIPVLLMTLFRTSLRSGAGMDFTGMNMKVIQDAIEAAIWDNFRIYQNFYGMVNVIPNEYGYVFGRQIVLGTIYMVIPRIIWPGKLSSYGGYGLTTLIGSRIASGQAYPNIGEYYYAGGLLSVLFFMGIYGTWMKHVRDRFMYSNNSLDWITFSVLLGSNLQLIIRGYTPSNFWYVVFAVLPVWIIKRFGSSEV